MTIFRARSARLLALKKKPAAMSTCGGAGVHSSRGDCVVIENGPNRTAAIVAVVDPRQRRVQEIIGIPFEVLRIEPASLDVGIERVVIVGDVLTPSLVVEALAEHVDQDEVLPIRHPEARRASAVEDRTAGEPLEMPVIVLASDRARLGHVRTELADLVIKTPQRRADRHGRELAAGILVGPRHAGETAILFGQARVEHAPKVDIAGRAAGADDDGLARADIQLGSLVIDRDTEHGAGVLSLPVDPGHSVFQQDLDAGFLGRDFERSHQTVAGGTSLLDRWIGRLTGVHHRPIHHGRVHFARHRVSDGVPAKRIRRLVDKNNAVSDQPFKGGSAVVRKRSNDFAIVIPVVREAVRPDYRPVRQIAEQQVWAILYAIFLLHAGPAAERNIAAADDGVTANILFSLD